MLAPDGVRVPRPAITGRDAPSVHLPLRRLALCLDCDECFDLGYGTCPVCGSSTWSPVARFIDLVSEPAPRRAAGNTSKLLPRRGAEDVSVAKHRLIVARHRRELFEELTRAYAGHETVEVLLDRRTGERRRRNADTPVLERRRGDRRRRSALDEQLRTIGWALVLLHPAKSETLVTRPSRRDADRAR